MFWAIDTVERFQGGGRSAIPSQRNQERPGLPAGLQRLPARPPAADRGPEPCEAEDDPGGLPEHLLGLQPGRGSVPQLAIVEESITEDLHDAALGGREGWEEGDGVGRAVDRAADLRLMTAAMKALGLT